MDGFEVVDLRAVQGAEPELKETVKVTRILDNTYETSVEASAALLAKKPETFASSEDEGRFGLALLLKSYVPNVDCESLVNDARYEGVAVVDKKLKKCPTALKGGATVVGGVVAGACYRVWKGDVTFVELALVAVDGSRQGSGLGALVMRRVEERAKTEHGAKALLTYADNRAFAFFRRLGFSRTVTTPFAVWKPKVVDYSVGAVVAEKVFVETKTATKPVQKFHDSRSLATGVTKCTSGRPNCYCRSGRTRAIVRYDTNDPSKVLESYCSTSDAARKLGLTAPQITHVLSGAHEDAKGHKFRYAQEVPWLRGGGPRPVEEVDPESGDTVADYPSAAACSRQTGLSNTNIGMVCSGKLDHLEGRVFRFKDQRVYPCSVCGTDHDAGTLLLCDGLDGRCVSTAHTACIGLTQVPDDDWYCKTCTERGEHLKKKQTKRPAAIKKKKVCAPAAAAAAPAKTTTAKIPSEKIPVPKRTLRTKAPHFSAAEHDTLLRSSRQKLDFRDDDRDVSSKTTLKAPPPPTPPPPSSHHKKRGRPKKVEVSAERPRRASAQKRKYAEPDSDDEFLDDASAQPDDDDDEDFSEEELRPKKKKKTPKKKVDRSDDWCASCGEGGDLICCDRCNRAYHLACADLDLVPDGSWFCLVCVAQDRENNKLKKHKQRHTQQQRTLRPTFPGPPTNNAGA